MNKLLVILGPTATGKTDLALRLASFAQGELVACDSRQVYRGLDIGTGKAPGSGKWEVRRGKREWEVGGIKIWLYDMVSPRIQYTVADYVKDASKVINGILERGKLPIIVGGTGLYLKALLEGLANLSVPIDLSLRKKLQKLPKEELQEKLQKISPKIWKGMNFSDRGNPRRLIRAIELTMDKGGKGNKGSKGLGKEFDILKIGLSAPREVLYKRVDSRVLKRIDQGMIEEAKQLYKNGLSFKRMKELGLEYRVLADYLSGKIRGIGEDQGLIRIMQGQIHGYIRRQLTWFKRSGYVYWFDITDEDFADEVEDLVAKWYHKLHGAKN